MSNIFSLFSNNFERCFYSKTYGIFKAGRIIIFTLIVQLNGIILLTNILSTKKIEHNLQKRFAQFPHFNHYIS